MRNKLFPLWAAIIITLVVAAAVVTTIAVVGKQHLEFIQNNKL